MTTDVSRGVRVRAWVGVWCAVAVWAAAVGVCDAQTPDRHAAPPTAAAAQPLHHDAGAGDAGGAGARYADDAVRESAALYAMVRDYETTTTDSMTLTPHGAFVYPPQDGHLVYSRWMKVYVAFPLEGTGHEKGGELCIGMFWREIMEGRAPHAPMPVTSCLPVPTNEFGYQVGVWNAQLQALQHFPNSEVVLRAVYRGPNADADGLGALYATRIVRVDFKYRHTFGQPIPEVSADGRLIQMGASPLVDPRVVNKMARVVAGCANVSVDFGPCDTAQYMEALTSTRKTFFPEGMPPAEVNLSAVGLSVDEYRIAQKDPTRYTRPECERTSALSSKSPREYIGAILEADGGGMRVGVELGVQSGLNLVGLGHMWPSAWAIFGVDPWAEQATYSDIANLKTSEQTRMFHQVIHDSKVHEGRVSLIRTGSIEAARMFPPGVVDFVYIDARHDYQSVLADLVSYWPLVREGGIVAGHDFIDADVPNLVAMNHSTGQDWSLIHTGYGYRHPEKKAVMQAVLDFAKSVDREVRVIDVASWYPSFIMRK